MTRVPQIHSCNRQSGISLIGMMVGLLISLLTVAAMLSAYRLMVNTSTTATGASLRDGQVSSALLAAQLELQQAGYGLSDAPATILDVRDSGRTLVWRYRPDLSSADSYCSGLRLRQDNTPGLYSLPAKACSSAATVTWDGSGDPEPIMLASQAAFNTVQGEVGSASLAGLTFQLLSGTSCTLPYGQQEFDSSTAYPLAQRVALAGSSGPAVFSACLSNIVIGSNPVANADTSSSGDMTGGTSP